MPIKNIGSGRVHIVATKPTMYLYVEAASAENSKPAVLQEGG